MALKIPCCVFLCGIEMIVNTSTYVTCLVNFACYTNLCEIYPLFIQSMLSRSFNSNFTAVSSLHCGSARDLRGSQGSLALSVADGRGSGGRVSRVSTCSRLVLLVHRREVNLTFSCGTFLENKFLLWVTYLHYLPVPPRLCAKTFCKADLVFIS